MLNSNLSGRGLPLLAALLALALSACERETGEDTPDTEAGRAHVEAMAEQHAEDTTEPSEAALVAPERRVVSEQLAYADVEDELVYGHFVFPEDMLEPLPGIIMIHEWWGLNDNIRAMADRLAGEGYIVLAIDLFGGQTADNVQDARKLMLGVVNDARSARSNIRQAYDFLTLTAGAPEVGSLGWCFGGGWSLNAAMLLGEDLDAAVIYYGDVTDEMEKLGSIEAPILGLFGEADRGIPAGSVRSFEATLERLGKDHEIHIYPGARHAFANPTGRNYNPEFAEDAWQRTLEFLGQELSGESSDAGS